MCKQGKNRCEYEHWHRCVSAGCFCLPYLDNGSSSHDEQRNVDANRFDCNDTTEAENITYSNVTSRLCDMSLYTVGMRMECVE